MKTKNKSLKSKLKESMRGKRELDSETNLPKIDPETNKPYPPVPQQICAYDIVNKYDRNMSLDEAIVFLTKLEEEDRMITKARIPDVNNDGVHFVYYYEHKHKRRDR
jgi:hypothetical protein